MFSQLRDALGTVPRNVNNGLSQMKETGTQKELKTIKRAVANFKTDLREKIKTTDDKSYFPRKRKASFFEFKF